MRRFALWVIALILLAGGLAGSAAYLIALVVGSDRDGITLDYGAVFAFSVVGLFAGIVMLLALIKRLPATTPLPNQWFSLAVLLVATGTGATLALTDMLIPAQPFLALLAAGALFAFFARLLTRWAPVGGADAREFVLPSLWGGIGAPFLAGSFQLVTVIALVAGAAAGLYSVDETLLDKIEPWLSEQVDTETMGLESSGLGILETQTVAAGAVSLLGITAPLTEELTKFLGVYLLFRKRVATRYGLFIAGIASGLGFAVVETLGYALMSGEAWPQILLVRAPVALIHMVCTAIVAVGWYQQRKRGGMALVGFFTVAVLVHAAWNTLFVSLMLVALGADSADSVDPAAGLMMVALVGAMGVVLIGSLLWLIGNARRFGRRAAIEFGQGGPPVQPAAATYQI